jgi:hypothetical protein
LCLFIYVYCQKMYFFCKIILIGAYAHAHAQALACCLTYPRRGNGARSALAGQGVAAVAAARFAATFL